MTQQPHLTLPRWQFLRAMKMHPVLLRRPFLSHELKRTIRGGHIRPVTGASMVSAEKAGWVTRISVGHGQMPFRTGGPLNAWQVTEAGKKAIAACPDTFPGEPVYGRQA